MKGNVEMTIQEPKEETGPIFKPKDTKPETPYVVKLGIFVWTLVLASFYPISIRFSKQGQETYPFMFPVALLFKNMLMLAYYATMLYFFEINGRHAYTRVDQPERTMTEKFYLSFWMIPNVAFTLSTDVLAFLAIQYISVPTYILILQLNPLFTAFVRCAFLKKPITSNQVLSLLLVLAGVIIFKVTMWASDANFSFASHWYEIFGMILTMARNVLKAANNVYVEWFTQDLKSLTYYEKQTSVSFWFVMLAFGTVIVNNGSDIIGGRSIFDGFAWTTLAYIVIACNLGISIYQLVTKFDSVALGICQMMAVPGTVLLEVFVFKTETIGMIEWASIFIIIIASYQYKEFGKMIYPGDK